MIIRKQLHALAFFLVCNFCYIHAAHYKNALDLNFTMPWQRASDVMLVENAAMRAAEKAVEGVARAGMNASLKSLISIPTLSTFLVGGAVLVGAGVLWFAGHKIYDFWMMPDRIRVIDERVAQLAADFFEWKKTVLDRFTEIENSIVTRIQDIIGTFFKEQEQKVEEIVKQEVGVVVNEMKEDRQQVKEIRTDINALTDQVATANTNAEKMGSDISGQLNSMVQEEKAHREYTKEEFETLKESSRRQEQYLQRQEQYLQAQNETILELAFRMNNLPENVQQVQESNAHISETVETIEAATTMLAQTAGERQSHTVGGERSRRPFNGSGSGILISTVVQPQFDGVRQKHEELEHRMGGIEGSLATIATALSRIPVAADSCETAYATAMEAENRELRNENQQLKNFIMMSMNNHVPAENYNHNSSTWSEAVAVPRKYQEREVLAYNRPLGLPSDLRFNRFFPKPVGGVNIE